MCASSIRNTNPALVTSSVCNTLPVQMCACTLPACGNSTVPACSSVTLSLFLPTLTPFKQGPLLLAGGLVIFTRLSRFYPVTLFSSLSLSYHPLLSSIFTSLLLLSLSPPLPLASPSLSSCCVVGLQLVLRGMSEALVDRRAAPALITLCSGPEL